MTDNYVELNRTFHQLSPYAQESDDFDLSQALHVGSSLTWADLTAERRVVILSEAGSGKTEEIRQAAIRLRKEGKQAFFLRLEHIPDDFETSFEVGSFEEFQAWLGSGEEGWLLLDSVDEARLRSPADFERAIRKLGRLIAPAADRSHIVITGRTWAWRPRTDLDLCIRHLSFTEQAAQPDGAGDAAVKPRSKGADQKGFRIVSLDDLTREQLEVFAKARGVGNTAAFLREIEQRDAWSFTTRPQDLEELIDFWKAKGRVGTRLDIMQNSIDRRLDEADQNRADFRPLAPERARAGARLVAAAATLAQTQDIQVPDGTANKTGISLKAVLPDWDDRDRATLLSRPIFDELIYETLRFHHRSVREYLTAEWLAELLKKTAARRPIEALLFKRQYGREVVVPVMRPILPWLALLDERIRDKLRKIAPEVLFEGGDPNSLPLNTRREILSEVCAQIAEDKAESGATDYAAVQRFADKDIVDDIRGLLDQHKASDAVRSFLVRMIWLGQLSELLPEAKTIAQDPNASIYTRIAAIRAVAGTGGDAHARSLRTDFLKERRPLSREVAGELLAAAPRTADTVDWLLKTIPLSAIKARFSADQFSEIVDRFARELPVDDLLAFIHGLRVYLDTPPFIERRLCEISKDYLWLARASASACTRLIEAHDDRALGDDVLDLLNKIPAVREYESDLRDKNDQFPKLVPEWLELNRALFWYGIDYSRTQKILGNGDRITNFWHAGFFQHFWAFGATDFQYSVDMIGDRADQDDKLVALSLAWAIYRDNGKPKDWLDAIERKVAGNAELEERLHGYLNPPPDPYRAEERKHQRRAAQYKRNEKKLRDDWREYVRSHASEIRKAPFPNPSDLARSQAYLTDYLRDKRDDSNRWGTPNWSDLSAEFGDEVAEAYRDGAVDYWRNYRPLLVSEGAPSNQTPFQVVFGLTGLEIESTRTPDWPSQLTPEDAGIGCRYAMHELNGFPPWFPKLHAAFPAIANGIMRKEILFELKTEKPGQEMSYVLSDVSWAGQWAWNDLAPSLVRMLQKHEPRNAVTLEKMLKIVQGSEVPNQVLSRLAKIKARSVKKLANAAFWFSTWMGVDPEKAIAALRIRLARLPTASLRTEFAMNVVTRLWGGRRSTMNNVRAALQIPAHIKMLFLLMHEHIRAEQDINRADQGVYSPELRDDAQDARDGMLKTLGDIPGKDAYLAMEEIAKVHPQRHVRPWIELQLKRKAEREANLAPWAPSQVRDFGENLTKTPTNHRELADLAELRLLDLKYELEDGDTSRASILKEVKLETEIRKFIGHDLREKAFGRYSIPQEEELADDRAPDLRFHVPSIDGPIPVELKLADNWSGNALFERLENQLAGDYLRDPRSTRGFFVLVYRGDKTAWELPDSLARVDFDGLVSALTAHWGATQPRYPHIDDIKIIGIDLTKRGW